MTREEYISRSRCSGRGGLPKEIIQAIHADYLALKSFDKTGERWNRSATSIRGVLIAHKLIAADPLKSARVKSRPKQANGCFAPLTPATPEEIDAIIVGMTRLRIPDAIRQEWRKWSFEKRGEFIDRVRKKLNSPLDRPTKPFSSNVEPFDYASPKAQEMVNKMNAGLSSQKAVIKIDLCSQGVIYKDRLFFWSPKGVGYVSSGPWTPNGGRPLLHHIIWEESNGPVPKKHTVIFKDGNRNNFDPANLTLRSMADCAMMNSVSNRLKSEPTNADLLQKQAHIARSMRRGQIEYFAKNSRSKAALLIRSFTNQKEEHEITTIKAMHQR